MKRLASAIRVRPDKLDEYKALHADPPAEILATLRAANVTNYSIFLRDGLLFSYLEYVGVDYDADMAKIANDPATRRWWEQTDPCQQPLDSAEEGDWWSPAEEVFHLD